MPQVPEYNRQVRLNGTPQPYQNYRLTEDMFGGGQAKALSNMGGGLNNLANAALKISEQIDDAKMLEMSNQIDQWEQDNLYNKDTGYYYKNGKDAVGKSGEIMKNFDDFVQEYKSKNKISPFNQSRMNSMIQNKKSRIYAGVNAHDVKQTGIWAETESQVGLDNAIKGMVNARNNPTIMQTQLNNAMKIIEWQGEMQNLDPDTIEAMKKQAKSSAYCSVLDSYISEGSLKAGEFFEQHKDEIDSKNHARYIGTIKNEETKYQARDLAEQIVSSSVSQEEAIQKAEAIQDIELSDMTVSRIKRHYSDQEHFRDLAEREALNGFYTKAVQAAQTGGVLSYDDIPDNIDPNIKLSLMNYINTKGQPETDNQVWETLYNMSVNNAQGFAKEDLNKYRGYLSDGEYKNFLKKQQDIQAGDYYTTIKDDDKMIKDALKAMRLTSDGKTASAFSEIRAMTRELEARRGRKITDAELQNITNSLGYKGDDGVQLYKQLERGMAQRAGFIRDVINDFTYYQSKHNGEMPPDAEKLKIINNRLNQKVQEKKTYAQQRVDGLKSNAITMRNIAYTTPRPNEQKVLTYFADNQIPEIGSQLGLNLTVTSRFRDQAGSKHREGRAADVSMSEHSAQNRIRIYEKLLSLPTVQAIGTSDPVILTRFAGNRKIVDERRYDKQHGTNHVNHAHVTLINANPARPAAPVNIVSRNNVYSF
nr:MAG TPA: hypothetical protein [Caudoviricetes sp.]